MRAICKAKNTCIGFFTLMSITNFAVLIKVETLTLHNRNIILFSELHEPSPLHEIAQLKAFKQLILTREKIGPRLTILVEQPIWHTIVPQYCENPNITTSIVDIVKDSQFKKTCAINAEIRFLSYIACHVLNSKLNPMTINPHLVWSSGNRSCILKELRFSSLYEEFTRHLEFIQKTKQEITPVWQKEVLNQTIDRAIGHYKELETLLSSYGLHSEERILAVSRKLYMVMQDSDESIAQKAQQQKNDISDAILNTFAPLLDAHLMAKTFLIPDDDVAIIAGYYHIARIKQLLIMHMQPAGSFGRISIDPTEQTCLTAAQIKSTLSISQPHAWRQVFCNCLSLC